MYECSGFFSWEESFLRSRRVPLEGGQEGGRNLQRCTGSGAVWVGPGAETYSRTSGRSLEARLSKHEQAGTPESRTASFNKVMQIATTGLQVPTSLKAPLIAL
ncbi:hypothetical protein GOODEAATRI_012949 [Goodea atripinnis]|uniref:Uncharacterized protein n=1 Tax=Goodea atripinnis TaxID=208336 RepID=A0ABV0PDX0_9TELE